MRFRLPLLLILLIAACTPPATSTKRSDAFVVPPGGFVGEAPKGLETSSGGTTAAAGSQSGPSGSKVPTPVPAGPTGPVTTPNGSLVIPAAKVDALRATGKTYIPLLKIADGSNFKWVKTAFYLKKGFRDFTASEIALMQADIEALNGAIGRGVFTFSSSGIGDIPITNQQVDAGGVLGFASLSGAQLTETVNYVEAKVTMNLGNLEHFTRSEPDKYPDLFKTVALHEFGHVAGLDHNPQVGTLMNAQTDTAPVSMGFGQAEIDTLKLLYQ